jgi:hypothetical protein
MRGKATNRMLQITHQEINGPLISGGVTPQQIGLQGQTGTYGMDEGNGDALS